MTRGLNECQFKGNLGRDPEMRFTPNGKAVVGFTVAVNREYKRGDEKVEVTTWVRCTAWGKLAEIVNKYCHKGTQVMVWCRYDESSYQKDGVKKYTHQFVVNRLDILSWKDDREGPATSFAVEGDGDEVVEEPVEAVGRKG